MDEPTDRSLKLQGLNRPEFDALSKEGKTVISGRSRRITELADIALAAELLTYIAESDGSSKAYIAEALDGKHPEFAESLRQIIREYIETEVETSIRDFYKIKYGSKGIIASAVEKSFMRENLQTEMGTKSSDGGYEAPAPAKDQAIGQPVPAAVPSAQIKAQPLTDDDRRKNIAMLLSRWDRRDVESVMRTDADIIREVMTITDQNSAEGITDESVFKAAEAMIKSSINGVQFYREAMIGDNREALLRIAKTFTR